MGRQRFTPEQVIAKLREVDVLVGRGSTAVEACRQIGHRGQSKWRKAPVSPPRERLYRLREEREWVEVSVPDRRIINEPTANAIERELARRANGKRVSGNGQPAPYLLSGLIKCGVCGSSFTLAGKDYYRCTGQRERGTCNNGTSVRNGPLEEAVLSALQRELLTADMGQLFADEFFKEIARRTRGEDTVFRSRSRG